MPKLDLGFFEDVADLYRDELWDGRDTKDAREALALFLECYAYEHQGRNPSFGPTARDAVKSAKPLTPAAVWQEFTFQLGTQRANPTHNPLWHDGKHCRRDVPLCALCWLLRDDGSLVNIVVYARECLSSGRTHEAFVALDRLIGIGPKKASLFLRDVADFDDIQVLKEQRDLIQPVDVWVGRIASSLMGEREASVARVQQWIIANSARPERANQGMWYFGANVAQSLYALDKALAGRTEALRQLEEYGLRQDRTSARCKKLIAAHDR